MTELKEQRLKNRMTQREAAEKAGISLRSYISYENQEDKKGTPMYRLLLAEMSELGRLDEEHGILTMEEIREACGEIMKDYAVQYCYLFGSYAKDKASEISDVHLLISTKETGLKFYGLAERLREHLKKKVDLISLDQLNDNPELLNEILKDGVKIYEQR